MKREGTGVDKEGVCVSVFVLVCGGRGRQVCGSVIKVTGGTFKREGKV